MLATLKCRTAILFYLFIYLFFFSLKFFSKLLITCLTIFKYNLLSFERNHHSNLIGHSLLHLVYNYNIARPLKLI